MANEKLELLKDIYEKVDEGVCDVCDYRDFDGKCFMRCNHEKSKSIVKVS